MPWLELSLIVDHEQQPAAERALEELGALAVTLADADADSADERAIFAPGAGETPLWARTRMQALFDADADRGQLADALAAALERIAPTDIGFQPVEDQDWERAWMDRFRPMRFGRRLWIYPWTIDPPADPELAIVRLDPGLAFGTGTHPTTALCLEWLDGLTLDGCHLIDYGCGSGILALAALKLGAARATGIDNDCQALAASRENAARNGVSDHLGAYLPDDAPEAPGDALVANILAAPLAELAPRLARLCQPGAPLALSGILEGQHAALIEAYAPWFEHLAVTRRDGWILIDGIRKT
jgi:ribosomal protein L11 methyltransferase